MSKMKLHQFATIVAILLLFAVLSSCGYRKEKEVRRNSVTNEVQYVIWVYKGRDIMTSYEILLDSSNCQKIDSLNNLADKFIEKAMNAENCQ